MVREARISDLVERMSSNRDKLLCLLASLTEEEASVPVRPGEWSVKQQMSHLCENESTYRAWLQRARKEDGANLDGVWGEPLAISVEEANQHSLAKLITQMRRQRAKSLTLIGSLRPDVFHRKVTSALLGTLTVERLLRCYYRHDRTHYDRLRRYMSACDKRSAGGRRPSQRRRIATG